MHKKMEWRRLLSIWVTTFWYSLDVNLVKIKKPNFVANFFKMFSLKHHKKNEWKIRVGKPFKKL